MAKVARPKMPSSLSSELKDEWKAFWVSPLASTIDVVDWSAIRRLWQYRDELEKLIVLWHERPQADRYTGGSNNRAAIRFHPDAHRIKELELMVTVLEDRLGLVGRRRRSSGVGAEAAAAQQATWEEVANGQANSANVTKQDVSSLPE